LGKRKNLKNNDGQALMAYAGSIFAKDKKSLRNG
jgi:hypothetical protein